MNKTTHVLPMLGMLFATTLPALAQEGGEDLIIMAHQAKEHINEMAQVCGNIAEATYVKGSEGEPTYLNFTNRYPRHNFTVIVWGDDRKNFPYPPESLENHQACVYGKITRYRSRPQMIITIPEQISARPLPAAQESGQVEAKGEPDT